MDSIRIIEASSIAAGGAGGAAATFAYGFPSLVGGLGVGAAIGWAAWVGVMVVSCGLLLIAVFADPCRIPRVPLVRQRCGEIVGGLGTAVPFLCPVVGFVAAQWGVGQLLALVGAS